MSLFKKPQPQTIYINQETNSPEGTPQEIYHLTVLTEFQEAARAYDDAIEYQTELEALALRAVDAVVVAEEALSRKKAVLRKVAERSV